MLGLLGRLRRVSVEILSCTHLPLIHTYVLLLNPANIACADDPLVPAVLLPFATQVALTTGVCIVEYLAWDDFSRDEQIKLGQLYVPYFVLGKCSLCCLHKLDCTLSSVLIAFRHTQLSVWDMICSGACRGLSEQVDRGARRAGRRGFNGLRYDF